MRIFILMIFSMLLNGCAFAAPILQTAYTTNSTAVVDTHVESLVGSGLTNAVGTNQPLNVISISADGKTAYFGTNAPFNNTPFGSASTNNTGDFDTNGAALAAASAATNGYPWSGLYDTNGAANAASNQLLSVIGALPYTIKLTSTNGIFTPTVTGGGQTNWTFTLTNLAGLDLNFVKTNDARNLTFSGTNNLSGLTLMSYIIITNSAYFPPNAGLGIAGFWLGGHSFDGHDTFYSAPSVGMVFYGESTNGGGFYSADGTRLGGWTDPGVWTWTNPVKETNSANQLGGDGSLLTKIPFAKTFTSDSISNSFSVNGDGSTNVFQTITNLPASISGNYVLSTNGTANNLNQTGNSTNTGTELHSGTETHSGVMTATNLGDKFGGIFYGPSTKAYTLAGDTNYTPYVWTNYGGTGSGGTCMVLTNGQPVFPGTWTNTTVPTPQRYDLMIVWGSSGSQGSSNLCGVTWTNSAGLNNLFSYTPHRSCLDNTPAVVGTGDLIGTLEIKPDITDNSTTNDFIHSGAALPPANATNIILVQNDQ